jgi:hypothetical protein
MSTSKSIIAKLGIGLIIVVFTLRYKGYPKLNILQHLVISLYWLAYAILLILPRLFKSIKIQNENRLT